MTIKVITGVFGTFEQARAAVEDLEGMGVEARDISLVSRHPEGHNLGRTNVSETSLDVVEGEDFTSQAGVGMATGGVLGLLAGLGIIAVPGVGVVAAAGWLATTMLGAGIGGATTPLLGKIISAYVHHANHDLEDADFFANHMGENDTLVTVRCSLDQVGAVEGIFHRYISSGSQIRERDGSAMEEGNFKGEDII